MKFTLNPLFTAMAIGLTSQIAFAAEPSQNEGTLSFTLKAMHIVDAKDNGFDPAEGTAEMFKGKYDSATWNNLSFGIGYYLTGDFGGMTDVGNDGGKDARGMFVNNDYSIEDNLGEAYIKFNNGTVDVFGGRMIFDSPLTSASSSTMPNFHTAFGANFKASDSLTLGIAQITQISLGARTSTEFGLIGEGTGTAGTNANPSVIGQAEFHDVSYVTTGNDTYNTNGITMVHANFKASKNLTIRVWDFYAEDISNNVYLEANHITPMQGKNLKLSAQYLTQSDVGRKIAGDLDFALLGVKAAIGNKKWNTYVALNQSSGDTDMLNAWSGDPGYTSTTFSRNEYRENVTAYKVSGQYKISPKWIASAGYANYGQSDTLKGGSIEATSDATELDLALTWKPTKSAMLKLTHANRVSEYDNSANDLTQAHTRLIGVLKF